MKKLNFELLYPSTININHSALFGLVVGWSAEALLLKTLVWNVIDKMTAKKIQWVCGYGGQKTVKTALRNFKKTPL